MGKRADKTLTVHTLDGTVFYCARVAIGAAPRKLVVTERPRGELEITPEQAETIKAMATTATQRSGAPKFRAVDGDDADAVRSAAKVSADLVRERETVSKLRAELDATAKALQDEQARADMETKARIAAEDVAYKLRAELDAVKAAAKSGK